MEKKDGQPEENAPQGPMLEPEEPAPGPMLEPEKAPQPAPRARAARPAPRGPDARADEGDRGYTARPEFREPPPKRAPPNFAVGAAAALTAALAFGWVATVGVRHAPPRAIAPVSVQNVQQQSVSEAGRNMIAGEAPAAAAAAQSAPEAAAPAAAQASGFSDPSQSGSLIAAGQGRAGVGAGGLEGAPQLVAPTLAAQPNAPFAAAPGAPVGRAGTMGEGPAALQQAPAQAGHKIEGAWGGFYYYGDARTAVPFNATFVAVGNRLTGDISEPATFGDGSSKFLHARISGGAIDPPAVRFTKQYDGTGGVSHVVEYFGKLSADGRTIRGQWTIQGGGGTGAFEIQRSASNLGQ